MRLHVPSLIRISIAAICSFHRQCSRSLRLRAGGMQSVEVAGRAHGPYSPQPVCSRTGLSLPFSWLLGRSAASGLTNYMTTRLADVFLLVSLVLLIASVIAYVGRWQLSLASALVLAMVAQLVLNRLYTHNPPKKGEQTAHSCEIA